MPQTRIYAGVALIAAAILLLELTLIRVLSVTLWYPFAYAGISTAMLGSGAAAVVFSLSRRLREVAIDQLLWTSAAAFGLTAALGYPLWNSLPVRPMSVASEPLQLVWLGLLLVILALPFAAAGVFLARVLSAWPRAAPALYAADLAGAAAGVVLFVSLLPRIGGPGCLLLAAFTGMLSSALVHEGRVLTRMVLVAVATALVPLSLQLERVLPLRITENKLMGTELARSQPREWLWSLSSTINVIASRPGSDPVIVIDGGTAMTWVPRARSQPESDEEAVPRDLRRLAFEIVRAENVLVVGSGGGSEVRAALDAGAERILALEIDPRINELVRGRLSGVLGRLFHRRAVQLETAEARSYLAAHPEQFDVILAFHTISNAASSTGAMSLAENYLLTVEALELLLARLAPRGVLIMTRPEPQLGRLARTVADAWPAGSNVAEHVAVITQTKECPDFLAAILVSNAPLDATTQDRIRELTPGRVVYLPDGSGDSQEFFGAALAKEPSESALRAAKRELPYDPAALAPATDDRPFFNLHRPWQSLDFGDVAAVLGSGRAARARLEDLPVGQVAILLLLSEVGLLALLFVLPPALALRRSGISRRHTRHVAIYFAALGFAFITVEVVLIQSLTRIVGQPAWSMVAVLAPLLCASGAGSLLLAGRLNLRPSVACAAAVAAALIVGLATPTLASVAAGFPFPVRLGIAALATAPVGFLMGGPFAAGLKRLDRDDLIAWAWALNGLLSVAGSVAALVIGSTIGFSLAAVLAALAYGAAAWSGKELASARELDSSA